jgi:hypothetical protein
MHFINTISIIRAVRNGQLQTIPSVFLVAGDYFLQSYGGTIPTEAVLCDPSGLEQGRVFHKFDVFEHSSTFPADLSVHNMKGFHLFKAIESPLKGITKLFIDRKRPTPLMKKTYDAYHRIIAFRVFLPIVVLGLIVNIIRVASQPTLREPIVIYEAVLINQAYLLLPGWLCLLPLYRIIIRSLGSAQVISLNEALQVSKLDYIDEDDVDEFDAAPPPTQDITTDWSKRAAFAGDLYC